MHFAMLAHAQNQPKFEPRSCIVYDGFAAACSCVFLFKHFLSHLVRDDFGLFELATFSSNTRFVRTVSWFGLPVLTLLFVCFHFLYL